MTYTKTYLSPIILFVCIALTTSCGSFDVNPEDLGGGNTENNNNNNNNNGGGELRFSSQEVTDALQKCTNCHGDATQTKGRNFQNYSSIREVVNTDKPEESIILAYGSNSVDVHSSGDWTENGPKYSTILSWIQQGALE